jgi:hypothetical protein
VPGYEPAANTYLKHCNDIKKMDIPNRFAGAVQSTCFIACLSVVSVLINTSLESKIDALGAESQ